MDSEKITVSKHYLELLATFIIEDLKCHCQCTYEESTNQPCLCGWTHIVEIFEDEFNIDFKQYPKIKKIFYKEAYGQDIGPKGID